MADDTIKFKTNPRPRFGLDLEWNPSGAIVNKDGQGRTLTYTGVDGEQVTYDTNALLTGPDRVSWGSGAFRLGFDVDAPIKDVTLRFGVRPAGVSLRHSLFRADAGEGLEQNSELQNLFNLSGIEASYSFAFDAGVVVPKIDMPVGLSFTGDVGGLILNNKRNSGIPECPEGSWMTGAYNCHNKNWNDSKTPLVARFGIGPKLGPVALRFVFDTGVDQAVNTGSEKFSVDGEEHAVMGTAGPDNIPFGLKSQGKAFEVSLDVVEAIQYLVKKTEPARARKGVERLEAEVEDLKSKVTTLEGDLAELQGELAALTNETEKTECTKKIKDKAAEIKTAKKAVQTAQATAQAARAKLGE